MRLKSKMTPNKAKSDNTGSPHKHLSEFNVQY